MIPLAVVLITSFSLLGSAYARHYNKPDALIALYVLFTTLSQIMASKIAIFELFNISVTAPAAVIVFAVTFLFTDIVNEKFGQRQVHLMIFITFITQVAMVLFLFIGGSLPPAPFWNNQESWDLILGTVPRITYASWITFLVSENLDAWLYNFTRKITNGKHLWARNVFSSFPALTVDTVLFVSLAFVGTGVPLLPVMKGQFITKYMVCLFCIPFMYFNKSMLGTHNVNNLED
jgi:uncharacterized integral membrane protein (TIGR00697 family)